MDRIKLVDKVTENMKILIKFNESSTGFIIIIHVFPDYFKEHVTDMVVERERTLKTVCSGGQNIDREAEKDGTR